MPPYSPPMIYALDAVDTTDIETYTRQALAADWACFTAEADRVDHVRLRNVIAAFPQGFRVYFLKRDDGRDEPVGYTGWYPVAKDVFDRLHDNPVTLTHRRQIMPAPAGDYLYLFNYSIVPALKGTEHSRRMIKELAQAVHAVPHKGLAAVTVSPDGERVAKKFGMSYRGDMTHDGVAEGVYAVRL